MNKLIKKMITRHTIRCYQNRQIDGQTLEQILLAGLHAPSAGNNQRSRIVVCQNREINEKLGKLSRYMQYKDRPASEIAHHISAEQPSIKDDITIMDGFYHAPTVLTIFSPKMDYTLYQYEIKRFSMKKTARTNPYQNAMQRIPSTTASKASGSGELSSRPLLAALEYLASELMHLLTTFVQILQDLAHQAIYCVISFLWRR